MIQGGRLVRRALLLLLASTALGYASCEPDPTSPPSDLAITGATLIDGTGAPPRPETTILVRDRRVSAVLSDSDADVPDAATLIDAAGKYVISGLADMAGSVHAVWDRPFPDTTLADEMAAAGFYVMPTISLFAGRVSLSYIDEPIDLDDPFLRETVSDGEVAALRDPEFVRRFRAGGQIQLDPGSDRTASIRRHMEGLLASVGMLHERGVPIVLGTDTGPPYVFPGYSVHRELELLVRAGLTPMEALEAATRRAAEMLDADDEFGTVEPGKRADLLILGANPLEDIRNTRTLEAVIAEGQLVDRASLPIRIR